jgi:hypothetical protein
MSTISLRLPQSLHDRVRKLADEDEVSINQFITTAVAEKMSALLTAQYLGQRAKQGRRRKFDRVLKKVRSVEPEKPDKLS